MAKFLELMHLETLSYEILQHLPPKLFLPPILFTSTLMSNLIDEQWKLILRYISLISRIINISVHIFSFTSTLFISDNFTEVFVFYL